MRPHWFVALPVSPGSWFEQRVGAAPAGVRLFHGDDLHLTVAFLGAVTEEAAHAAWARASAWPDRVFEATLGEVVPMGPPRRFSALSALLARGRAEVEDAIGACRESFWEAAGARANARPPRAHLTVARVGRGAGRAQREAALAWAAALDLTDVCVRLDRLALYTRAADPGARRFRIVAERTLGGGNRGGSAGHESP